MAKADHAAEARPAHVAGLGARLEQLHHRGSATRVRLHPQVQRAQAAVNEEAVERAGTAPTLFWTKRRRS